MATQTVVLVFPCHDLKATLTFYNALGFATLHEQHAPYAYGSVRFEQIQIDFYGSQATAVAEESGTCASSSLATSSACTTPLSAD